MYFGMWIFCDYLMSKVAGFKTFVDYSEWKKNAKDAEEKAENENSCCKGSFLTWYTILFCLWSAFSFIFAPVYFAFIILFVVLYLSSGFSILFIQDLINKGFNYHLYFGPNEYFNSFRNEKYSFKKIIV